MRWKALGLFINKVVEFKLALSTKSVKVFHGSERLIRNIFKMRKKFSAAVGAFVVLSGGAFAGLLLCGAYWKVE